MTTAWQPTEKSSLAPLLPLLQTAKALGLLPYSVIDISSIRPKLRHSRPVQILGAVGAAALILMATLSLWQDACTLGANLASPSISTDVTEFILNCFSIVLVLTGVLFARRSCDLLTSVLRYLVKVDSALGGCSGRASRGLIHVVLGGSAWFIRSAASTWLFGMQQRDVLLLPLWLMVFAAEQLVVGLCLELARRYRAVNGALDAMRTSASRKKLSRRDVMTTKVAAAPPVNLEELSVDSLGLENAGLAWLEAPPSISKMLQTNKVVINYGVTPQRLEGLREAHAALADAFQELNSRLGVFLLLDLAYLFVVLLSASISFLQHCVIKGVTHVNHVHGDTSGCLGHSVLALDGLVRMAVITIACGAVGEEAERTAEAAARLLRRVVDWDSLRELQILGSQVRARRVAFWACGLFTVDRPLLFSICGAVTSYLFILSQLK